MKTTKLCELFSYENVLNEGTKKAKILVWNNKTMLIAEENSALLCGEALSFEDLILLLLENDLGAVTVFLYAAMSNSVDVLSIEDFLEYFEYAEFEEYTKAVEDGISHYLPDEELRSDLKELALILGSDSANDLEPPDHWAGLYFFCKKQLLMSDEEFLNSTWRKISVLQKEFYKTLPEYHKNKLVSADEVDI